MSQPDLSLRKVKKNGREMAEIMAVTNEAGYGSSINPGWGLNFFVILILILPTGGSNIQLNWFRNG